MPHVREDHPKGKEMKLKFTAAILLVLGLTAAPVIAKDNVATYGLQVFQNTSLKWDVTVESVLGRPTSFKDVTETSYIDSISYQVVKNACEGQKRFIWPFWSRCIPLTTAKMTTLSIGGGLEALIEPALTRDEVGRLPVHINVSLKNVEWFTLNGGSQFGPIQQPKLHIVTIEDRAVLAPGETLRGTGLSTGNQGHEAFTYSLKLKSIEFK